MSDPKTFDPSLKHNHEISSTHLLVGEVLAQEIERPVVDRPMVLEHHLCERHGE